VEIGRQPHKLAPVLRFLFMDEDNVNIRGAAKHGVKFIVGKRTRQVRGDDVLIVERAFLRGLFGYSDE
jgi:hypothetical protein